MPDQTRACAAPGPALGQAPTCKRMHQGMLWHLALVHSRDRGREAIGVCVRLTSEARGRRDSGRSHVETDGAMAHMDNCTRRRTHITYSASSTSKAPPRTGLADELMPLSLSVRGPTWRGRVLRRARQTGGSTLVETGGKTSVCDAVADGQGGCPAVRRSRAALGEFNR